MKIIGKAVMHNKFGKGKIIDQTRDYISVKFDKEAEPKRFVYPECLEKHLKIYDSNSGNSEINFTEQPTIRKQEKVSRTQSKVQSAANKEKTSKSADLPQFTSVEKFCDTYKAELSKEIAYVKRSGEKRYTIYDGRKIESTNNSYIYSFESEEEMNYPENTQISIWKSETSSMGTIISCEEFTIIFSTHENMGEEISSVEISAESWRLLNTLNERMDELSENPPPIAKSLICDGLSNIDYSGSKVATSQSKALQMAENQPITFIWGPPGTGKTQTLAEIALNCIKKRKRVLMLSYSNVSVDGAIMRVHKLSKEKAPGVMLRYGYPRQKELLEHEYLTAYNYVIKSHPELVAKRKALIDEKRHVYRKDKRYLEIEKQLKEIKEKLSEEEKRAVNSALFVATTVSKAVVDSVIYTDTFDTVIFDEASMAYLPQIVFSAGLASKHFVCIGDFRQLPPIVQCSDFSILNKDIFQYCKIDYAVDHNLNHKWLCMLDTQHRMHPAIADFASAAMYNGLLKSDDKMEEDRQDIAKSAPAEESPIAFADLSGMMSVCTKTSDDSRVNVLSAILSFALALKAAQTFEVGIITPYRSQSRLLHAMSRDFADLEKDYNKISCATVHQFQGSEKDIIIYDAVDCYRMTHPGKMLSSLENNYANRLFNVALTRAKGKFVAAANVDYMKTKRLSKKLIFEQLIEAQQDNQSSLSGEKLLEECSKIENRYISFPDSKKAKEKFTEDLSAAMSEIRIDIPDSTTDNGYIGTLAAILSNAKERGVKVYLRAENKNNLPSAIQHAAIENSLAVNPIAIIDKKII